MVLAKWRDRQARSLTMINAINAVDLNLIVMKGAHGTAKYT